MASNILSSPPLYNAFYTSRTYKSGNNTRPCTTQGRNSLSSDLLYVRRSNAELTTYLMRFVIKLRRRRFQPLVILSYLEKKCTNQLVSIERLQFCHVREINPGLSDNMLNNNFPPPPLPPCFQFRQCLPSFLFFFGARGVRGDTPRSSRMLDIKEKSGKYWT